MIDNIVGEGVIRIMHREKRRKELVKIVRTLLTINEIEFCLRDDYTTSVKSPPVDFIVSEDNRLIAYIPDSKESERLANAILKIYSNQTLSPVETRKKD